MSVIRPPTRVPSGSKFERTCRGSEHLPNLETMTPKGCKLSSNCTTFCVRNTSIRSSRSSLPHGNRVFSVSAPTDLISFMHRYNVGRDEQQYSDELEKQKRASHRISREKKNACMDAYSILVSPSRRRLIRLVPGN